MYNNLLIHFWNIVWNETLKLGFKKSQCLIPSHYINIWVKNIQFYLANNQIQLAYTWLKHWLLPLFQNLDSSYTSINCITVSIKVAVKHQSSSLPCSPQTDNCYVMTVTDFIRQYNDDVNSTIRYICLHYLAVFSWYNENNWITQLVLLLV